MTKAIAKALQSVGVPAVRWSDTYRQYYARIGYSKSRSGTRQRAFHYLGIDEREAVAQATARKLEWRKLKARARALGNSCPVWPDTKGAPVVQGFTDAEQTAAIDQHHAEMTADALEQGTVQVFARDRATGRVEPMGSDTVAEQKPTLRLEQVREMYVEYRRAKIGIGGGQGIDKTFSNESRNLKGALSAVDQSRLIDSFGYAEIEQLRDSIFRRVGAAQEPLSKRTANNYWLEAKRLLDWADRQSRVPYEHPKHVAELFRKRFRNADPVNIAQYDKDQLTKLLKTATDRQRLYVYLALNCGYYQGDIGSLRLDEIGEYNGKPAIVRKRAKTSHQNDFEALHTLWPETYELLQREKAKPNAEGLALLSERGTPLYRKRPHCDIVSDTYLTLRQRAGVTLPFKQFRKLGATAIQRIGGDEARRLYKAGTIDSGDKVYVTEAWEKLTPHLLVWGDELRRDKVLTVTTADKPLR
jgi:hypothetical protein